MSRHDVARRVSRLYDMAELAKEHVDNGEFNRIMILMDIVKWQVYKIQVEMENI